LSFLKLEQNLEVFDFINIEDPWTDKKSFVDQRSGALETFIKGVVLIKTIEEKVLGYELLFM
jgi:hypothetical protein